MRNVEQLAELLRRNGCVVVISPRHTAGLPCIHCGMKLELCKKFQNKLGRCCPKCGQNGKDSHR